MPNPLDIDSIHGLQHFLHNHIPLISSVIAARRATNTNGGREQSFLASIAPTLLWIVVILSGIGVWWSTVNSRLSVIESTAADLVKRIDKIEAGTKQDLHEALLDRDKRDDRLQAEFVERNNRIEQEMTELRERVASLQREQNQIHEKQSRRE
jgi:hypothetical protein